MKKFLFLPFILLIASCSLAEGMQEADTAVAGFHTQFNAENYAAIYENATPALKSVSPEEEFISLMESIHSIMGSTNSSVRGNLNIRSSIGTGTTYNVSYKTTFENGSGTETFIFVKGNEVLRLQSYNFNSNDYIRLLREMAEAKPSV